MTFISCSRNSLLRLCAIVFAFSGIFSSSALYLSLSMFSCIKLVSMLRICTTLEGSAPFVIWVMALLDNCFWVSRMAWVSLDLMSFGLGAVWDIQLIPWDAGYAFGCCRDGKAIPELGCLFCWFSDVAGLAVFGCKLSQSISSSSSALETDCRCCYLSLGCLAVCIYYELLTHAILLPLSVPLSRWKFGLYGCSRCVRLGGSYLYSGNLFEKDNAVDALGWVLGTAELLLFLAAFYFKFS